MRKLQRPAIRALGCLHSKSTVPQAQLVPSPCSLVVFSGTWQENLVHTICHSRYCRSVGGRAQHTRDTLVQLCKHDESPMSSSLLACRNTTCTEPRREACITCTCTNFGPQNFGRKSNVCAHNNRSVPIEVLTPVNSAPWCVIQKSLVYYPPIELHGHRGCAWRVIKCVPLVTDFMGRVYSVLGISPHVVNNTWILRPLLWGEKRK
jgi:hypothetical protein